MAARVTRANFELLTESLHGLPISAVWRGYGSAIFLELGELTHPPERRNPRGQASVMIQWSWRVEATRSILFGSWSGERKINSGLRRLEGRSISSIALEGRIPELVIGVTGGLWLHSFQTAEGQPEWTVFLHEFDWLHVVRGVLIRETWVEHRNGRAPGHVKVGGGSADHSA